LEGTVRSSFPPTGLYNPKAFITHAALLRQAFAHCGKFLTAASRRSLGRVSVPVWLTILSDQLPIIALVGHYPTNKLIGREPVHERVAPLLTTRCHVVTTSGINPGFPGLSRTRGWVAHVLLTRSPLDAFRVTPERTALDLHVSCTPPALILSQDQTLRKNVMSKNPASRVSSQTRRGPHVESLPCGGHSGALVESRLHSSIVKVHGRVQPAGLLAHPPRPGPRRATLAFYGSEGAPSRRPAPGPSRPPLRRGGCGVTGRAV
jgi:hypothetical protein